MNWPGNSLTILLLGLVASRAWAAEPPPQVRRVYFPADQVEKLGDRYPELRAMSRDEFDSLLRRAQGSAADSLPQVDDARYQARLDGNRLIGTAELRIRGSRDGPTLLRWPASPITIRRAQWGDRPASVGYAGRGELAVAAPAGDEHVLTFDWSAAGLVNSGGLRWLLRLPPSLHGELAIDLPRGWSAIAPAAIVAPPSQAGDMQRWAIQFRPTEPLILAIVRNTGPQSLAPLVLYANDTEVELAPDGVSVVAKLSITVAHQPVRSLDVECGAGLKVFDWSGIDVSDWHERDGKLHLELVEPLVGPAEVTLRAIGSRPDESRRWDLPRLALGNAFWTGGRTRLPPPTELNLYDIRAANGVVTAIIDEAADSPTFVVDHRAVDAGVSASTSPRGPIVSCEIDTEIEWSARVEAVSTIEWRAVDGETSEVRLRVPSGWSVESVEPVQEGSLAQWSAEGRDGDVLRLRCARPVSAASPFAAQVRLIGPSLETAASPLEISIPRLTALGARVARETLTIGTSSTWSAELTDTVGLHPVQAAERTFQFDRPDARARLVARPRAAGLAATVNSVIRIDAERLRAAHAIDVAFEGGPVELVDVVFSSATGDSVEWRMPSGARVERLPQSGSTPDAQESWRVTLPRGQSRRTQLQAIWQTRPAETTAVPLPTVRNATATDGRVRLRTDASLDVRALVSDLAMAADSAIGDSYSDRESDDPAPREQWWTYSGPNPQIAVQPTLSPLVRPAAAYVKRAAVRSTLGAHGESLHLVRYEVRGPLGDAATLRLPAGAVAVRAVSAGEVLAPDSDNVIHIPPSIASQAWTLQVEYALAGPMLGRWARRDFSLPVVSLPVLASTWQFETPFGYRPAAWSPGVNAGSAVAQPSALVKLFGPLARTDRGGSFEFWKPSAWRRWWKGVRTDTSPANATTNATPADPVGSSTDQPTRPWRFDRAGELRMVSVVVVDEAYVRRIAWLVAIASLGVGLLVRSKVGACAVLSIAGLIGAIAAPYPLNVPFAAAGWSQFAIVVARRLMPRRTVAEPDPQRGMPATPVALGTAGAILLWLLVGSTVGAQSPRADKPETTWTVFLPYDPAAPEKWQDADRVLVPRATHEQLVARAAGRRRLNEQVLVRSARYSGKIVDNRLELAIDLDLENFGGAGSRCTLPLTGLSIRSASLDGEETLLQPEPDGLAVRVGEPGVHRMHIEADVAIDLALGHGAIELGVAAAPIADLSIDIPADLTLTLAPGVASVGSPARTLRAELGASDRITMRWRRNAKPPAVRVDSAAVVNWTAAAAWIEQRLVLHADPGPLDRVVLVHDPRLAPGAVRAPGLAGYWVEDAGDTRRLIMEFDRPIDDPLRVAVIFFVRGPLGAKLTAPMIEVADAQSRLRLLALGGDAAAQVATVKNDGIEPAFEDDFQGLWGESLPAASSLRFVRVDDSVRDIELERIETAWRQLLEVAADLEISATRVGSITRFTSAARDAVFAHEVQIPAGMQVRQVQVTGDSRWHELAEDRLLWFGESTATKRPEIRVDGWVSRDADSWAIPVVRPLGDCELTGTIRNWRARDVRLEVSDVTGMKQSSVASDEVSPFGDRVLDSRFVVESAAFGAMVRAIGSPAAAIPAPPRDSPPPASEPRPPAQQDASPRPTTILERHRAQIREDGTVAVESTLMVRSPASSDVRLAVPYAAQVLALTVNGRDVSPRDHSDGGKAVYLAGRARDQELKVMWLWQATSSVGGDESMTIALPRLAEAPGLAVWAVSLPESWRLASVAPAATTRSAAEQAAAGALAAAMVGPARLPDGASDAATLSLPWTWSEPTQYFVTESDGLTLVLRPTQGWVAVLARNVVPVVVGLVVAAGVLLFGRTAFRLALPIALVLFGSLWCWRLQPEPVGPLLLVMSVIAAIVSGPLGRRAASPAPSTSRR